MGLTRREFVGVTAMLPFVGVRAERGLSFEDGLKYFLEQPNLALLNLDDGENGKVILRREAPQAIGVVYAVLNGYRDPSLIGETLPVPPFGEWSPINGGASELEATVRCFRLRMVNRIQANRAQGSNCTHMITLLPVVGCSTVFLWSAGNITPLR